jgi:hypothetical protein
MESYLNNEVQIFSANNARAIAGRKNSTVETYAVIMQRIKALANEGRFSLEMGYPDAYGYDIEEALRELGYRVEVKVLFTNQTMLRIYWSKNKEEDND